MQQAGTLLYSRSQHLTILSRPQENMYGERAETAMPVTCKAWGGSIIYFSMTWREDTAK